MRIRSDASSPFATPLAPLLPFPRCTHEEAASRIPRPRGKLRRKISGVVPRTRRTIVKPSPRNSVNLASFISMSARYCSAYSRAGDAIRIGRIISRGRKNNRGESPNVILPSSSNTRWRRFLLDDDQSERRFASIGNFKNNIALVTVQIMKRA